VGVTVVVALLASLLAVAAPAQPSVRYLESRQQASGGFAEPGRQATPGLTAWAVLGQRAAGVPAAQLEEARRYLERSEPETVTDAQLVLLAVSALGPPPPELVARVRAELRPSGAIGPTVNSTIWGILALRAAGEPAPATSLRWLLRHQRPSGGWPWHPNGAPDSNDTAAAIQALRAAGIRGAAITRGLAYLRRHQRPDGGFELVRGRGSDVQSTAWAVQAFVAAGQPAPAAALRYLARMRRPDGSYRYSARYAATPVWVTSQALAAVSRRPLPIRAAGG
jgi:hypothetical protein